MLSEMRRRRPLADVRYWDGAKLVAMTMLAIVGVRLHESVPYVALIRPAAIAAYGGLALLLMHSSAGARREALSDRSLKLMGAYWLWAAVTAPFALWPGLAVQTVQSGITLLILAFAILLCAPDERTLRFCSRAFLWTVAALGALTMLHGIAFLESGVERLTTEATLDSNDLAAVMAMALPFGLASVGRERGWARALALVSAGVCVTVVVKTGSRGGTIAALVGCVIYAFGVPGKRKFLAALGLIAGFGLTWALSPPAFRERIAGIGSLDQDYNYTAYSGRKQIWARARGYIMEHPVAGVGIGNFPIAEGGHATAMGLTAKWSAAHNAYIQAFAELGFVGGGIFIWLLLTSGKRAWSLYRARSPDDRHRLRPEYLASLGAFCSSAYFLSHAYFYPLFGLLALIALAWRANQRRPAVVVLSPARRAGWRSQRSQANGVPRSVA
jgi:O-antigen ligase